MNVFPGVKIWQAARATSAAPTYFKPMIIDNVTFLDGGLQANNPVGWLWKEILTVFGPVRPTACLLSIGTGIGNPVNMTEGIFSTAQGVPQIATNSAINDILFRSLIDNYGPVEGVEKYWRFNLGDGRPKPVKDKLRNIWWKLREKIGAAKGWGTR